MRIPKINTIHYDGKWIAAGTFIGIIIPLILWLILGKVFWFPIILGSVILILFLIVFLIEMHQDNGKVPYHQKHLGNEFQYDPDKQIAVIRSSICTGEKVAGFRDKATGHFTEVILLRSPEDELKFMQTFHLSIVKIEY